MSDTYFPRVYTIGHSGKLTRAEPAELDLDPRGLLFTWEPPLASETYVMGIDPTQGRTGWNRYARVKEDTKTDNGAIIVIRIGRNGNPDYQVAEYAAPIDAVELGDVANVIGRLYSGTDEDQCKCIIEVYPGPGALTLQQMLRHGYTNHFFWEYYAGQVAQPTKSMGWHASPKTNRDLWVKCSRHINLKQCVPRSPHLVEELADCRMNPDKQWAENTNGHDDRVRAYMLAVWMANGWSMDVERKQETVAPRDSNFNWQATDMSWSDIMEDWYRKLDEDTQ